MASFAQLVETFGYELLPIVPANATLSSISTLSNDNLGKVPGLYNKSTGEWSGFPKWTTAEITPHDILDWDTWPECAKGVRAEKFPAFDIDIDDPQLSREILGIIFDVLPPSIVRRREDSGRLLICYSLDPRSEPINGLERVVLIDNEGEAIGMVELLGPGHQFVIEGPHKSGKRQWFENDIAYASSEALSEAMEEIRNRFASKSNYKAVLTTDKESSSYEETVAVIANWGANTGRHDALRDIIYGMIQDGRMPALVKTDVESIMNNVPEHKRDKTWFSYFQDIPRLIKGAADKTFEDVAQLEDYEEVYEDVSFPLPIGKLALLTKSVLALSPHPNIVVSTATSIGLVAGIVGRRFNTYNMGLNVYISLLMESGMGKDVIQKFIARMLLNNQNSLTDATTFLGAKRYTGPKALLKTLAERRSCISVFSEAGFMFQSTTGDMAGLTRVMLDLFTKSGSNDFVYAEEYSSENESTKIMRAPSFSMINESTPRLFIDSMKRREAQSSGELARMALFRVDSQKALFNREMKWQIHPEVEESVESLFQFCSATQFQEDPEAVNIVFEDNDRLLEWNDEFTIKYNELIEEDPFRAVMYSRAWQKLVKFAGISGVFDMSMEPIVDNQVFIKKEHTDWAYNLHLYEMSALDMFMKGSSEDPIEEIVRSVAAPVIRDVINSSTGATKVKRIFIGDIVAGKLRKNKAVAAWSDTAKRNGMPMDGPRKIFSYLENAGYVKQLDEMERRKYGIVSKHAYQCRKDFDSLLAPKR